jgi:hypothetical protein
MNGPDHERARELVLMSEVEGLSNSEAVWLEAHLTGCADCSVFAEELQLTARALRNMPVTASASLVMDTQALVRARAAELRDHEAKLFLIGISFCLGLLWSAGSAFVGWKLSAWLAERIHVPQWAVAAGLVVFWLAPAVAMALAFMVEYRPISHHVRPDWTLPERSEELQ